MDDPQESAEQDPSRASPRIGRFLVDDGAPVYYIFVENRVLMQVSSFTKALFLWFSVHYVFT